MKLDFHALRVRAVQADTAEAVVVSFDVPEALRPVFGFTQGQYLTLRKRIGGQELRRSYSICAGVDDGELRVGVRKVQGGVFSNWINEHLLPGDRVDVMAPQGRFFVPLDAALSRHHVGIAGGSGITPVLSIMKTVLAREPQSCFTLIYGNRRPDSTMFKEELDDLKNRHLARLAVHHVFSQEGDAPLAGLLAPLGGAPEAQPQMPEPPQALDEGAPLHQGLMDRHKIARFLGSVLPAAGIDEAYVCGPFQMNDEAEAALLAAGVAKERIHIERFGVPLPVGAVGAVLHEAAPGDAPTARIVIVRDGVRREVPFIKGQPSILDAATAAGLDLPFSCTSGVCGTCRARCLEGRVRMERNFALDPSDLEAGFVLTCQAHPLTERVVLSFDDR